jgi:phospholipase D1/2
MADAHTDGADGHHSIKDKIAHPFHHLHEKLKNTHLHDAHIKATHVKNKLGKFKNLVNSNHRHDEEHEKETDEKRSRVCGNHRFNSFAPERDGNLIKWYVDGRDYFWVRTSRLHIRGVSNNQW